MQGAVRIKGMTRANLERELQEARARAFIDEWLRKPRHVERERQRHVRDRVRVAPREAQRVVEMFEQAMESGGGGVRLRRVRVA